MKTKRLIYSVLGLCITILYIISYLPLSTVMNWLSNHTQNVSWTSLDGTIWAGRFSDLRYDNILIGDVDFNSTPWRILTGNYAAKMKISGAPTYGNGEVMISFASELRLRGLNLRIDLGAYDIRDVFNTPMQGVLEVNAPSILLSKNQCDRGTFYVWTDALLVTAKNYGGEGFQLDGEGTCDDGRLVLPLQGANDQEAVAVQISVEPNLQYQAYVEVTSPSSDLQTALQLYGFDRQGDQLVMIQRGHLLSY